ncbi:MAG: tetraacyldisaccharide 4'-kinase [Pseudomonadota bacterium]
MALEEAPPFWWKRPGIQAIFLAPVGYIYGKIAGSRMNVPPSFLPSVPVICIGNFIIGGAGKTPTVELLTKDVIERGMRPGILTRGYGGAIKNATIVRLDKHNSKDVGDEALLHASQTMTVVSADRPSGAKLLVENGCDLILMDDGFQNPSISKDYCLVVVDSNRGLGNGMTFPAGPLRVPFGEQLRYANGVLFIGESKQSDKVIRRTAKLGRSTFHAEIRERNGHEFDGKEVFAFAGISDPEKFYFSLSRAGAEIKDRQSFGDHHYFTDEECNELLQTASSKNLVPVTTTKDRARLRGMGEAQQRLHNASKALEIELVPEHPDMLNIVIETALKRGYDRTVFA